jgi:RimJ/RimL family protein N-acetyltransferase
LTPIVLSRATTLDIPLIMQMERRPGYEPLVGRWSEQQHRDAMADSNYLYYLGARSGQAAQAFAILRDLKDPNGNLYLKRICVLHAGEGFGQPFLRAVMDWVFGETEAHRFWLEVVEDNHRARHVYAALGFVEEGVAREVYKRNDGSRGSGVQMSILRREWELARKA